MMIPRFCSFFVFKIWYKTSQNKSNKGVQSGAMGSLAQSAVPLIRPAGRACGITEPFQHLTVIQFTFISSAMPNPCSAKPFITSARSILVGCALMNKNVISTPQPSGTWLIFCPLSTFRPPSGLELRSTALGRPESALGAKNGHVPWGWGVGMPHSDLQRSRSQPT